MQDKNVAILLATYNGEKYLAEQLDSLYNQTYKDWTIYVHDDGSTDHTVDILKEYAFKHDNLIILDYPSQHGPKDNFLSLLQKIEADYYFFCDQDDVWLDTKIEKSLVRMIEQESLTPNVPILVYSDLYIVDAALRIEYDSFMHHAQIYPQFITNFSEIAAINLVTGCTMLINHQGKKTIVFPTTKATMHDTWITACILKYNGVLSLIPSPLIYYRQHENNNIGANNLSHLTLKYILSHIGRVITANRVTYQMLRTLGYGSVIKYFYYKIVYMYKIRKYKER